MTEVGLTLLAEFLIVLAGLGYLAYHAHTHADADTMMWRFGVSLWYHPSWFRFFRKSWKKRNYWVAHQRHGPGKRVLQAGPIQVHYKREGKLNG